MKTKCEGSLLTCRVVNFYKRCGSAGALAEANGPNVPGDRGDNTPLPVCAGNRSGHSPVISASHVLIHYV